MRIAYREKDVYKRQHYEDTMTSDQWDAYASNMFSGFDTDRTMLRISAMKMCIRDRSGGPTAVINSSLAGVYKTARDRGAKKVYGMLHGIQGLLQELSLIHI